MRQILASTAHGPSASLPAARTLLPQEESGRQLVYLLLWQLEISQSERQLQGSQEAVGQQQHRL